MVGGRRKIRKYKKAVQVERKEDDDDGSDGCIKGRE